MNIIIVANAQTKGDALSGADRIFIELAKRWAQMGHHIQIITCREGLEMCQRYGLTNVSYLDASIKYRLPLYILYTLRMVKGSILIRSMVKDDACVVYSSSDFWPDSFPAFSLKLKSSRVKWVAGFYLFAPPLFGNSPYKGQGRIRGLFYSFSQPPVFALVRKFADMVWVTSKPDISRFEGSRILRSNIVAVRGGVDVKTAASFCGDTKKEFDAVFIGRFHPQKGVLELIDIWQSVCKKKPSAKLAIIGVGDLEQELRAKVKRLRLEKNVVLYGFRDGVDKLKIFSSSKVVVHPAIYDSGGMAACEAMACGLPGVSFDLPALRTYYPKGMIKTPCFDVERFAKNILKLLDDPDLYVKTAKDALDWAREWDWDKRADDLLNYIKDLRVDS